MLVGCVVCVCVESVLVFPVNTSSQKSEDSVSALELQKVKATSSHVGWGIESARRLSFHIDGDGSGGSIRAELIFKAS